jgi:hypothetical protein
MSQGRKDRLVENFYWIGRAEQQKAGGKIAPETKQLFEDARNNAADAFAANALELGQWRARIDGALAGKPVDEDHVVKRAEKMRGDREEPKQEQQYKDLLQFLNADTSETEGK